MSELKEKILSEYEKGNIVIATIDGDNIISMSANLDEFINQPTDGLLYDLNRGEETVLTFIDDPKWINDYAVCKVIRALKKRIDELETIVKDNLPEDCVLGYDEVKFCTYRQGDGAKCKHCS
jgi:hypothetical protein